MNRILAYFDLNTYKYDGRILSSHQPSSSVYDSQSAFAGSSTPKTRNTKAALVPLWKQLIFYVGTLVGILFSSGIMQFQAGKTATVTFAAWTIVLSAVIALAIMPYTYKKAVKPDAPFIVQLGLFVQEGVFWSVLLTSIGKVFG